MVSKIVILFVLFSISISIMILTRPTYASSRPPISPDEKEKQVLPSTSVDEGAFLQKSEDLQTRVANCQKQSDEIKKKIRRGLSAKAKLQLKKELVQAEQCVCEIRREGLRERILMMKQQLAAMEKQYQDLLCPLDGDDDVNANANGEETSSSR
ncbi:MAG: hypothetical protein HQK50_06355 [Oligoflexia bacterium]|nr:hypothetical protein [Oligoflexia bacterium]MBF0365173.1 hypothetical protein [Oligoflexia bacterium]